MKTKRILLTIAFILVLCAVATKSFWLSSYAIAEEVHIKNVQITQEGGDDFLIVEGGIFSSALFYSGYTSSLENGVLKLGVKYSLFKPFNNTGADFSIKLRVPKDLEEVYLTDGEVDRLILKR